MGFGYKQPVGEWQNVLKGNIAYRDIEKRNQICTPDERMEIINQCKRINSLPPANNLMSLNGSPINCCRERAVLEPLLAARPCISGQSCVGALC